jgi:hypothetical protein
MRGADTTRFNAGSRPSNGCIKSAKAESKPQCCKKLQTSNQNHNAAKLQSCKEVGRFERARL